MSEIKSHLPGVIYLDFQAEVGITKHVGGFAATDELLSLCHIEDAKEVLNIGCGIGVGVAYIARKFGCRVVGVDISGKMIDWSRLRAREEKVEDKVEFKVANVLDLPFEDNRFDAVIVESVLAFVDDKPRAIRECIRVTKPGGYVGLNESFWTKEPSPEMIALAQDSVGSSIPTEGDWKVLWEATGLRDRTMSLRRVDTRHEISDRLKWVGRRWALRGFGRLIRLFFTNPGMRQSIKKFFSNAPLDAFIEEIGYGLFTGKK
jgi:ubiquinone/menaquinone biosynthesis C-methylase UbiE